MKLKEKLAIEWSDGASSQHPSALADAYHGGFEEARELAAQLFRNSLNNPKYVGLEYKDVIKAIASDMLLIGEEEVDE